jgi:hypothetical protein
MTSRTAGLLPALALVLAAACSDHSSPTSSTLPQCAAAQATTVTLSVGGYTAIDPATDSGCVAFPANASASDSAEYLVVAQSAGGAPGDSVSFRLLSATLRSSMTRSPLAAAVALGRRGSIPLAFDRFLHELARSHGASLRAPAASPRFRAPAAVTPPTVGSLRTFTVCAAMDCSTFKQVTGRVRAVSAHVAVYVDTLAPAGGLDSASIAALSQTFDTHGYDVDTAAFGGISDIDSNGVVITLMTPVVNSFVTAAQCVAGGYVAGFFFPPDLDPQVATQFNDGEIFYTIVADPNGTLSCSHSVADVEYTLPSTFVHELEHVISFNQHVLLRGGDLEDLWLDEALASFAEELAGRSFLPDQTTFSQYVVPNLFNASEYLASPGSYFLLQTGDTVLAEFGAGWLYVRYLVDQFGSSVTNKLEETALIGTTNVTAQTGVPFATSVTRWALANWVSDLNLDLPGFTPPPELIYSSWSFRQTYASLHAQDPRDFPNAYPLVPVSGPGTALDVAGFLRAGSGYYARVLQAPRAAGFTLLLSGNAGPPASTVVPRFVVVRIR